MPQAELVQKKGDEVRWCLQEEVAKSCKLQAGSGKMGRVVTDRAGLNWAPGLFSPVNGCLTAPTS